jgi:hypothetical protein
MTIAELWVNLGVKGADNTKSGLRDVEKGLSNVKGMAWEAKAAIVAALYSLEQMMKGSADRGAKLVNFAAFTGLSLVELQRWQKVGEQFQVTNEDMESSIIKLQSAMAKMRLGQGAPEGFAVFAKAMHLGKDEMEKIKSDPFYFLKQLQGYVQTAKTPAEKSIVNQFASSMLTQPMSAAMSRNAYTDKNLGGVSTLSAKQAQSLANIDRAWTQLWQKFQFAMDGFVSKHGMKTISDLSKLSVEFIKFAEALVKLSDKMKVLNGLSNILEAWAKMLGFLSDPVKKMSTMGATLKAATGNNMIEAAKKVPTLKIAASPFIAFFDMLKSGAEHNKKMFQEGKPIGEELALPNSPATMQSGENNIAITNNFSDNNGEKFQKTGDAVYDGVMKAYRNMDTRVKK